MVSWLSRLFGKSKHPQDEGPVEAPIGGSVTEQAVGEHHPAQTVPDGRPTSSRSSGKSNQAARIKPKAQGQAAKKSPRKSSAEGEADNCLVGMLVMVEDESFLDTKELADYLLDHVSQDGNALRYYTENETRLVTVVDPTSGELDDTEALSRGLQHFGKGKNKLFAQKGDGISVNCFCIEGVGICLLQQTRDQEILPSSVLVCRHCGESYDVAGDAVIAPGAGKARAGSSEYISQFPHDAVRNVPGSDTEVPGGDVESVLRSLKQGEKRRWHCEQGHVNGYPGSFMRDWKLTPGAAGRASAVKAETTPVKSGSRSPRSSRSASPPGTTSVKELGKLVTDLDEQGMDPERSLTITCAGCGKALGLNFRLGGVYLNQDGKGILATHKPEGFTCSACGHRHLKVTRADVDMRERLREDIGLLDTAPFDLADGFSDEQIPGLHASARDCRFMNFGDNVDLLVRAVRSWLQWSGYNAKASITAVESCTHGPIAIPECPVIWCFSQRLGEVLWIVKNQDGSIWLCDPTASSEQALLERWRLLLSISGGQLP